MKSFMEWSSQKDTGFDVVGWLANSVVSKEFIPQIDDMIDKWMATSRAASPLGDLDSERQHVPRKDEVYSALIEGLKKRSEDFKFYHR